MSKLVEDCEDGYSASPDFSHLQRLNSNKVHEEDAGPRQSVTSQYLVNEYRKDPSAIMSVLQKSNIAFHENTMSQSIKLNQVQKLLIDVLKSAESSEDCHKKELKVIILFQFYLC